MSGDPNEGPALGRHLATVLRGGTLVAVLAVTVGLAMALFTGEASRGARPLSELLTTGDADAVISAGLLGLTLLPLGVLGVAAWSFGAAGERRYLVACGVTLLLLLGSLVIAAVVAPSS